MSNFFSNAGWPIGSVTEDDQQSGFYYRFGHSALPDLLNVSSITSSAGVKFSGLA